MTCEREKPRANGASRGKGLAGPQPSGAYDVSELLSRGVEPCGQDYWTVAIRRASCGRPLGHRGIHRQLAGSMDVGGAVGHIAVSSSAAEETGELERAPSDDGCPHDASEACQDCLYDDWLFERGDREREDRIVGV